MIESQWQEVERIFCDALEQPEPLREAFVRAATPDQELCGEILRLLTAHASAHSSFGLGLARHNAGAAVSIIQFVIAPGDLLAGRYRIVRQLGKGGMGQVYEAEDLELGEHIALKAVHSYNEAIEDAFDRLKRELRLTRRLTHPNICRVFDLARHQTAGEDFLFFTMELLHGSTLEERLKSQGRFGVQEVTDLAFGLVSALKTAHENGVVHRDLKPGNIMLVEAEGSVRPVIMDFGVAKVLATPGLAATLSTASREVGGTPAYMAPEQLLAKPVTEAADVYSLGLVLYELLCGCSPFPGSTLFESALRRLHQPPVDPRKYRGELPSGWVQLVLRCLKSEPHDRPSDMDLLEYLQQEKNGSLREKRQKREKRVAVSARARWIGAALLLISAGVSGLYEWHMAQSSSQQVHVRRVTIMPFSSAGGSEQEQALAQGFSTSLSRRMAALVPAAAAVAWVSPEELRSQHVESVAAARSKLGIDWVLSGTLGPDPAHLETSISVSDSANGTLLRAFTVDAADYDSLLSRTTSRIGSELGIAITPSSVNPTTKTVDPAAQKEYMQAVGILQKTEDKAAIASAIVLLRDAVKVDPQFAAAYIELARAARIQYETSHDAAAYAEAQAELGVAGRLEPKEASILVAQGELLVAGGKYADALNILQTAQQSGAGTAELLVALGRAYNALGLKDRAEASLGEAVRRNPRSWSAHHELALFYYRRGEYDKAALAYQEVLALSPDNARVLTFLGGVMLQLGRWDDSRKYLLRAASIEPTASVWINLGSLHVKLKQWDQAASYYQKALESDPHQYKVWEALARTYAHLPGQADKSKDALLRAAEMCRAQLKKDPENVIYLSDLANFLAVTGKRQEPLELIQRALALAPANVDVMINAAEVYEALGFRTEALDWTQKAVEQGFPLRGVEESMALDSLRADSRYSLVIQAARKDAPALHP
jgi:serine/threonine protein kinase/tetratricopeptide (TPR) repeat protein